MSKKLKIVSLALVLAVASFWNCEEDNNNTIVQPETGPKLQVSTTDLEMTGNPERDKIDLSVDGADTLSWQISEKPDWIIPSDSVGVITSQQKKTIHFVTDFSQLTYGEHSGTIKISSDDDEKTVNFTLNYKAPELIVHVQDEVLNFDRHYFREEIEIENTGGGELAWELQMPEWLNAEQTEGTIWGKQSRKIDVWVDFGRVDYGEYNSNVLVKSNGGDEDLECYLSYQREVEVFPGEGAGGVYLGDTVLMVKKVYGEPNKSGYERPTKTHFIHWMKYNRGIIFMFDASSPVLWDNVDVTAIQMIRPFDGLTPKKIGLGSSFDDVKEAYGEADSHESETGYYVYDIGIKFKFDRNDIVSEMYVE